MAMKYLVPRGTRGTIAPPDGGQPNSLTLKSDFESNEPPELDGDNAIFTSDAGWKLKVPRRDVVVSNDGTNSAGV